LSFFLASEALKAKEKTNRGGWSKETYPQDASETAHNREKNIRDKAYDPETQKKREKGRKNDDSKGHTAKPRKGRRCELEEIEPGN